MSITTVLSFPRCDHPCQSAEPKRFARFDADYGRREGDSGEAFFLDINGDGVLSPLDALILINHLNQRSTPAINNGNNGSGSGNNNGGTAGSGGPIKLPDQPLTEAEGKVKVKLSPPTQRKPASLGWPPVPLKKRLVAMLSMPSWSCWSKSSHALA